MTGLGRLRKLRDELASMTEDPQHGFGAEVGDRGIDLTTVVAEFEMRLPDGSTYEIQIRSTS